VEGNEMSLPAFRYLWFLKGVDQGWVKAWDCLTRNLGCGWSTHWRRMPQRLSLYSLWKEAPSLVVKHQQAWIKVSI